jgi:hypothetical protein
VFRPGQGERKLAGSILLTNRKPAPRHSEQILLRSKPVAPQQAHSSQSAILFALRFIPWQRSPPMTLLHRPLATEALYPAAPHSVQ